MTSIRHLALPVATPQASPALFPSLLFLVPLQTLTSLHCQPPVPLWSPSRPTTLPNLHLISVTKAKSAKFTHPTWYASLVCHLTPCLLFTMVRIVSCRWSPLCPDLLTVPSALSPPGRCSPPAHAVVAFVRTGPACPLRRATVSSVFASLITDS